MSKRLPAQFKIAFIRLGFFGCLMALIGLFALGYLFKEYMVRDLLQREAIHSLEYSQQDTRVNSIALPEQLTLVVPSTASGVVAPQAIKLDMSRDQVLREQAMDQMRELAARDDEFIDFRNGWRGTKITQNARTVFVVKDVQYIQDAFFKLMALVSALVLLTFGLVTWQTYLSAKRLLKPIQGLSDEVKTWSPGQLDPSMLLALETQSFSSAEARSLWKALQGLAVRVNDFVRRERNFLRDASHELRTPLTVVRVATDMLRADDQLSDWGQRNVAKITAAVDGMESRIKAMMLLTRENELDLLREPFDVNDVVDEQVALATANGETHSVPIRIEQHADPMVVGAPIAMGLILEQLLSNALQFTEEGEIVVHVYEDEMQVCDTGIGMSDEARIRAFDPLFREDPARNSNSGMGLSLARQLADRAGWGLELRSTVGEGTCVVLNWRPKADA